MPYVQVGDCSIYHEEMGLGEPILFLHSGYSRGIIAFGGQIQPFFHRYRCLLPDFRGHGRTTSENPGWNTVIIAEDMVGFLDALSIERAHLIGYSLGGGVALHLAAQHPERVRTLTTIGCGGVADPAGSEYFEPEALLRNGQTEFIERIQSLHMDAHGGDWAQHMRQSVLDWRMYPNLSDEEWKKLAMPMFCIAGETDAYATPQRLADIKARCSQAKTWIVPGCGHRPHMPTENVREVNDRILAFLQALQ